MLYSQGDGPVSKGSCCVSLVTTFDPLKVKERTWFSEVVLWHAMAHVCTHTSCRNNNTLYFLKDVSSLLWRSHFLVERDTISQYGGITRMLQNYLRTRAMSEKTPETRRTFTCKAVLDQNLKINTYLNYYSFKIKQKLDDGSLKSFSFSLLCTLCLWKVFKHPIFFINMYIMMKHFYPTPKFLELFLFPWWLNWTLRVVSMLDKCWNDSPSLFTYSFRHRVSK